MLGAAEGIKSGVTTLIKGAKARRSNKCRP